MFEPFLEQIKALGVISVDYFKYSADGEKLHLHFPEDVFIEMFPNSNFAEFTETYNQLYADISENVRCFCLIEK